MNKAEPILPFIDYIQFISDMLGGDLLPLNKQSNEVKKMVNERAIDYELMRSILTEVQKHNSVFYKNDQVEAYPTLDALGLIRGNLLRNKGDVHQISLIDRIGELTVSFFKLKTQTIKTKLAKPFASIHYIK